MGGMQTAAQDQKNAEAKAPETKGIHGDKHAYLGISVEALQPDRAKQLPEQKGRGVEVAEVFKGSPAELAGLKAHDVLVRYDDQHLYAPEQLVKLVRHDKPGRVVVLEVISSDKHRMVKVTLGQYPVVAKRSGSKDETGKEAKIAKIDVKTGTVTVKMQGKDKEVEKIFKLAEEIEYMDSTGKVATVLIFTSGDLVLIVESEGTITKMTMKDSAAVAKQPDSKDKTDTAFIRAADQINLVDMKLGKVAQQHAASDAVKKYGERAVRDYALMNHELREITSKNGIKLSEKLDKKHQEFLSELAKLIGTEFDRAYTKDMVAGHEKAIEMFENEAKHGGDADVKAWAEKCLPTLREHLKLAQAAVKDVNGK
jgi:putative membrane protein